jgi:hypothetical protein
MAEVEKSLDQLMQLAMSVYYNWDLTKKREKDKQLPDLIAALREYPTLWGAYISSLLTLWTLHRECPKEGHPGRQPQPPARTCPLCKGYHWRSKCPHLQAEGGVPPPIN